MRRDAGRHGAVPARGDLGHLDVVFDHLVQGQQIQDRFRQVVGITAATIGAAGGNGDDHRTRDALRALRYQLPAGVLVTIDCTASTDARGRARSARGR